MSSENRKQSIESIGSLPWEDPIHWGECLEAIYHDDTGLPAQYLRTAESIDRRIIRELADKLDPSDPKLSRYVLRKRAGRPRKHSPVNSDDPIEVLLDNDNPPGIADYLRRTPNPDARIVAWLADRLDPTTADGPRLVVKQPIGKPSAQSRWQSLLVGEHHGMKMLGLKVERKRRELGKLEAALHYFTQENKDWPHPVSRSKARRAHQVFLKVNRARKNHRN
ncbi:MAG: hypothetical protein JWP84_3931 [Tardiphaga sp.]|jgi:hypothetical protein|nr:hypothetical protein [Tardiphaga sp.]